MSRRTYGQYCGVAHALDVIGERWTLLLIRELLTGPKRYKDLLSHLPGIGTNLLAKRLQFLEEEGLVERSLLPPPASTEAYVLTEHGRALEPVLLDLARWGYRTMPRPDDQTVHFAAWSVLAMKAVFRPERAGGLNDAYEYRVDGDVFHARIKDGALTTGQGPLPDPDFVLETDGPTFLALVSGGTTAAEASRAGTLRITGDAQVFERSTVLFDLSELQLPERDLKVLDLTGRKSAWTRSLR